MLKHGEISVGRDLAQLRASYFPSQGLGQRFPSPYQFLSRRHQWLSASNDCAQGDFSAIWRPRFPIDRTQLFITAGSCFAANVTSHLSASGFRLGRVQEASPDITATTNKQATLASDSLGLGNTGLPSLICHWIRWALEAGKPQEEPLQVKLGYLDQFDAKLKYVVFESKEAVLLYRKNKLEQIKGLISSADIFIVTLGFTEGWVNRFNEPYAASTRLFEDLYHPNLMQFKLYSFSEVYKDLSSMVTLVKKFNPCIKFIFTVSPVPLYASFHIESVISTNNKSKSILRAVVSQLQDEHDFIDYFPSYEIITSTTNQGRYYETDFRQVTGEGVRVVMSTFDQSIQMPGYRVKGDVLHSFEAEPTDCDGIISKKIPLMITQNSNIFLIGDSHLKLLKDRFEQLGLSNTGHFLMNGSEWDACYFDVHNSVLRQRNSSTSISKESLQNLPLEKLQGQVIITNVGCHLHCLFERIKSSIFLVSKSDKEPLSNVSAIKDILMQYRFTHLQLLRILCDVAKQVILVTDPPLQHLRILENGQHYKPVFEAMDSYLKNLYSLDKLTFFCPRDTMTKFGYEFDYVNAKPLIEGSKEIDWVHGNTQYYSELAQQLVPMLTDTAKA